MKETYNVKCPRHVIFGDPMYFENFKGAKLKKLVVNEKIPKRFDAARVVIEEFPDEYAPDEMAYWMTIYIAPRKTINTYVGGQMYSVQKCSNKDIGVDTASYIIEIDDQYDEFSTGADGYWGNYIEYFRKVNDEKIVDAIRIEICMSFYGQSIDNVRRYVNYFFEDVKQIENLTDPE